MPVCFSEVKQILDDAIAAWSARTGRSPNLALHGAGFGWETREQLLSAVAFDDYVLVSPEMIGNGRGHETNLVIALTHPSGVDGLGRMPKGGPYLTQDNVDVIIAWINDGALGAGEAAKLG